MPQLQHSLVKVQHRLRIFRLRRHVVRCVRFRHRQPGLRRREPSVRRIAPLHRSPLAVASLFLWPAPAPNRILHILLARRGVVLHPQLFAVVHDGRAVQSQVQPSHQLGNRVIMLTIAIAVIRANNIVVTDDPNWPMPRRLRRRDLAAQLRRRYLVHLGEQEVHRQLNFVVVLPIVIVEFGNVLRPGFADQDSSILIGYFT